MPYADLNLLTPPVWDNLMTKVDKYVYREPAEKHKIVIFTNEQYASRWSQIANTSVHVELPMVPVPESYTKEMCDEFMNQIGEFIRRYSRDLFQEEPWIGSMETFGSTKPEVHLLFGTANPKFNDNLLHQILFGDRRTKFRRTLSTISEGSSGGISSSEAPTPRGSTSSTEGSKTPTPNVPDPNSSSSGSKQKTSSKPEEKPDPSPSPSDGSQRASSE